MPRKEISLDTLGTSQVPLGIVCAVNRGNWTDRLISFGLFLLYSIPPFVAGMLFLLFFCYGDYVRLFPMDGLHSDAADSYGFFMYAIDYIWHIILPVVKPAIATVAIFTFQSTWNDFLAPLIYLHDQTKYTVSLGLSFFRSNYDVRWAYLMAASLTVTLPVIVVFFVAQRAFIEGITLTGIKG